MRKHGSVYWHVGNSGVTFTVVDEGHGPTFVVESGAFGNLNSVFKAFTDVHSLRTLAFMLLDASDRKYSEPHVHAASYRGTKVENRRVDDHEYRYWFLAGKYQETDSLLTPHERAVAFLEAESAFKYAAVMPRYSGVESQAKGPVPAETRKAALQQLQLERSTLTEQEIMALTRLGHDELLWLWREGFIEDVPDTNPPRLRWVDEPLKWDDKETTKAPDVVSAVLDAACSWEVGVEPVHPDEHALVAAVNALRAAQAAGQAAKKSKKR